MVYRDINRIVLGNISINITDDYESSMCKIVTNTSIIDSVLFYDIESGGSVSTNMAALELNDIKYFHDIPIIQSTATVDNMVATSQVKMPVSSGSVSPTVSKPKDNTGIIIELF